MFVARIAALAAAILCAASIAEARTVPRASQDSALTMDPHSRNEAPASAINAHVHKPVISRDPPPCCAPL
jgi:peptide/nickel transport system substrate-binding protein